LSLEPDDAELPLVEECGFRVVLEFGLGYELWEWECEEEVLEINVRRTIVFWRIGILQLR